MGHALHTNITLFLYICMYVCAPANEQCANSHAGADPGGGGDGARIPPPPPSQITITHARFYFYERP